MFVLLGMAGVQASDLSVYLVRHAEKATPSAMLGDQHRDPPLSADGEQRAQQLAYWLHKQGIESIWTSDYRRTRDTARPLADLLGLQPEIYDPAQQAQLAQALQNQARNALVVGHSNTIPELAMLLCQCPVTAMDDDEYNRLLLLEFKAGNWQLNTLDQATLFDVD